MTPDTPDTPDNMGTVTPSQQVAGMEELDTNMVKLGHNRTISEFFTISFQKVLVCTENKTNVKNYQICPIQYGVKPT